MLYLEHVLYSEGPLLEDPVLCVIWLPFFPHFSALSSPG